MLEKDYRALREVVRDCRTHTVFLTSLPAKEKRPERATQIWRINNWLQDWCHGQEFRYLGDATCFERLALPRVHGSQLHQRSLGNKNKGA